MRSECCEELQYAARSIICLHLAQSAASFLPFFLSFDTQTLLFQTATGGARGIHWVHMHLPRAEKNCVGPNLHGKVVSAPPGKACTPRQIGEIWTVGVDNIVVLACVLRATSKNPRATTKKRKRSSTFWEKKSAPSEKILATPMQTAERGPDKSVYQRV